MPQPTRYERLGPGYARQRVPDPRIASQLMAALGDAPTILNVGAGTGNYEPTDRPVIAVEPSPTMLAQRSSAVPAVRATAEHLPFPDQSFAAALAMFTLHHWSDRQAGLRELGRVSARQVILVYDPAITADLWLCDYFPELRAATWALEAPTASDVAAVLRLVEVRPMLVPFDCTDGFTGAYWGRPETYLEPAVQTGMSPMARLPAEIRAAGTERLRTALRTGEWDRALGHLRSMTELDVGYRLAICGSTGSPDNALALGAGWEPA